VAYGNDPNVRFRYNGRIFRPIGCPMILAVVFNVSVRMPLLFDPNVLLDAARWQQFVGRFRVLLLMPLF